MRQLTTIEIINQNVSIWARNFFPSTLLIFTENVFNGPDTIKIFKKKPPKKGGNNSTGVRSHDPVSQNTANLKNEFSSFV